MALDLNSDAAIDYSNDTELFPFETAVGDTRPYGSFDFTILSYTESGPAGTESNKSDKEYDLATLRVDASDNVGVKVGETYGFFFQTGGDGMTVKSRPYKATALRAFIAAAVGQNVKDRSFDATAARKTMLTQAFSADDTISLRTTRGNKREDGTHYRDDKWSVK
jgi:hypothetical protein